MKTLLICFTLALTSCVSQTDNIANIYFDETNTKTFTKSYDGYTKKVKIYRINKKNNKAFSIENEIFICEEGNFTKEINQKEFDKIKFYTIDDMFLAWKNSKLFANTNVYDKIFMVIKTNKSGIYKILEVKWASKKNPFLIKS